MNEFEQLRQMFSRAGVAFTEARCDGVSYISIEVDDDGVQGYSGFGATFSFDSKGALNGINLAEG
jgi:hypothetical protein